MTDISTLTLHHHPEQGVLTARWYADSPLPLLQTEYEAVLAAGLRHGSWRWLFDVRRRAVPTPEATAWVAGHWLPRAVAAHGAVRLRLAYFISPARDEVLRPDASVASSVREALLTDGPYDLRLFGNEGEALRWLLA